MKPTSLGLAYLSSLSKSESPEDALPFDRLVRIARTAPTPEGYRGEYDLLRPHFDHAYYLAANPAIARAKLDPLAHYIRSGDREGRNPAAWFSGKAYRQAVPEATTSDLTAFGHWVSRGREMRVLASPLTSFEASARRLGLDPYDAWQTSKEKAAEVRSRLEDGVLADMVAAAGLIEPRIIDSRPAATRPRVKPFSADRVLDRFRVLTELQEAVRYRPARTIVLTDLYREISGGFSGLGLALGVTTRFDPNDVVLLVRDGALDIAPFEVPEGLRVVDISEISSIASVQDQQRVLADLVRSLAPEHLIVFDSQWTHGFLEAYGRQISAETRHSLILDPASDRSFAFEVFDYVTDLVGLSAVQAEHLRTIPEGARPPVHRMWPTAPCPLPIARVDTQRPLIGALVCDRSNVQADTIMAIAAACPDRDFVMLVPDAAARNKRLQYVPANLSLKDATVTQLFDVLRCASCWLSTGPDNGLHLMVASTGVPVVELDLSLSLAQLQTQISSALQISSDARDRAALETRDVLDRYRSQACSSWLKE